jgi:hypothetical protein
MRAWRDLTIALVTVAALACLTSWAVRPSYLPPSNRVKGWLWRKPPTTYSPKTLYTYIDGAADLYLAYGFREATVVEFYRGKQDIIMLDVYDMGEPLHAFGIFNSEKPDQAKSLGLGAQSYAGDGLAAFWKGPYYVKLSVTDGKGEALAALARAADMYLPAPAELPVELRRLPAANRVAGSERYVKKDALGHQFLVEAIGAEYKIGKATAVLYVCDLTSPPQAKQALAKLRDFEQKARQDTLEISGLQDAFASHDSSLGELLAARKGRFAIIAASAQATREDLTGLVESVAITRLDMRPPPGPYDRTRPPEGPSRTRNAG